MCHLNDIEKLRAEYIDTLPFPEELYMEWLVRAGIPFLILDNEAIIGYFVMTDAHMMIEFYVTTKYVTNCEKIFNDIIEKNQIVSVMLQSFDGLILKCCVSAHYQGEMVGTIFRDFSATPKVDSSPYTIQLAQSSDFDLLVSYKDELYDSEEQLNYMIKNKIIYMYFLQNNLVGCGFLTRIRPNRNWYDIGMWVSTPYRKKGIGKLILSDLKDFCLNNKYRPICGCAANNLVSRKTIEKCGFYSKHALIVFKVTNPYLSHEL